MNQELESDNFMNGDEFDTDLELFELRKQYNEIKRERLSSQKNVDIMANKVKLLESEELNVKKTLNRQIVNKNQMIKKVSEIGAVKEDLIKARLRQESEAVVRSEKLKVLREKIKQTLKSYHKNVAEKNREEAIKQKQKKEEILEIRKEISNEIMEKKKLNHKIVREQVKSFSDKKKNEETRKKQILKEELAKKIKEENDLKLNLEQKMEKFEIKETELIDKISKTKKGILDNKN